jgi:hypothetical protein
MSLDVTLSYFQDFVFPIHKEWKRKTYQGGGGQKSKIMASNKICLLHKQQNKSGESAHLPKWNAVHCVPQPAQRPRDFS